MTTTDAFDAIQKGDLYALTAALDAGIGPSARSYNGWTLLMEAVYWNRSHMVDELLSRGANVHQKTRSGQTALHYATSRNSNGVFPAIFSAVGPSAMNLQNCYGCTPLHNLAYNGRAEQMAFVLSHPGIDVSIPNHKGQTPLDATNYRSALQTYRDQEARWRMMRYTWIKFLTIPTRR
jgi:ankyrin repeat protein